MQKGNKKLLIILIVIFIMILYGGVILMLSNNKTDNNSSNSSNNSSNNNDITTNPVNDYELLIINNYSIWQYKNNNWRTVDNIDDFNEKLLVYIDKIYYGNYYLKFINKWNLLNENKKIISYNGNILAHSLDLNIDVKNYIIENNTFIEFNEISQIIGNNITLEDLSINEKVITDLDSNNIDDKIINASNLDKEDQEIYFNLCYVVLNGNINILFFDKIKDEDVLIEPIYNLEYILNINNYSYDNIILQEGYFSNNGETKNIMYQYNGNEYIKIISN